MSLRPGRARKSCIEPEPVAARDSQHLANASDCAITTRSPNRRRSPAKQHRLKEREACMYGLRQKA